MLTLILAEAGLSEAAHMFSPVMAIILAIGAVLLYLVLALLSDLFFGVREFNLRTLLLLTSMVALGTAFYIAYERERIQLVQFNHEREIEHMKRNDAQAWPDP